MDDLQRWNYTSAHRVHLIVGGGNTSSRGDRCIDNYGGGLAQVGIQLTNVCGDNPNVNEWNYQRQGTANIAPGSFRNPTGVCWNVDTQFTGGQIRAGAEVNKSACAGGTGGVRHDY
ncbi:hypothetical protein HGQ17_02625 [Nesterenkonia sp. MY13]|uniref:Ricin B lectin domain-containing protein n=1 Tax=Nesterenkonia sedimenti TaxID=1463632 RepID=A0A7X8TIE8_9MICC|nr:hypothetical protein [Nesterenkonia sedimenti]NLS08912.1 hypothetical protein [Nesterenkonia sedimenti]